MMQFQGLHCPFGQSKWLSLRKLSTVCGLFALLILITPGRGNPLTKKQVIQTRKLLEEAVMKEYPSEDQDKYSDLLEQTTDAGKNMTYYHAGNPGAPVFVSFGLGNVGKKVHVLLRGEDYINPRDRNNYVVLLQQGSGKYSVHMAHIRNIAKIPTSKVVWNDGRIIQQPKMAKLLDQLGNYEVKIRSNRSRRPMCQWLGYLLMCNSKKRVPSIRQPEQREPLDKVDPAPLKLFGNSEESGGKAGESSTSPSAGAPPAGAGVDKRKRNTARDENSGASHRGLPINVKKEEIAAVADRGDGIEEEEEETVVFGKQPEPPAAPAPIPAPTASEAPALLQPILPSPTQTPSAPNPSQPSKVAEEHSEDPSGGSKKKHKRKHKPKPKRRKATPE